MSLLWEHDVNQLGYPIPREIHQTWRMKQIDLITSLRGMTLPIPKMGMGDAKQQQCFGDFLMNQNSTNTYFQRPYSWKYIIHQNVIDQNWWCNQLAKYSTWFVISIIFFFHSQERSLPHLRPVWASALIHFENHRNFHRQINGNSRILKWRYCTLLYHIRPIFCGSWVLAIDQMKPPGSKNGHCFIGPSLMSRCMVTNLPNRRLAPSHIGQFMSILATKIC